MYGTLFQYYFSHDRSLHLINSDKWLPDLHLIHISMNLIQIDFTLISSGLCVTGVTIELFIIQTPGKRRVLKINTNHHIHYSVFSYSAENIYFHRTNPQTRHRTKVMTNYMGIANQHRVIYRRNINSPARASLIHKIFYASGKDHQFVILRFSHRSTIVRPYITAARPRCDIGAPPKHAVVGKTRQNNGIKKNNKTNHQNTKERRAFTKKKKKSSNEWVQPEPQTGDDQSVIMIILRFPYEQMCVIFAAFAR